MAAALGKHDIVRLLCESRADVEAADQFGNRPLHRGAAHAEATRLLLECGGAQADVSNNDGDLPLHSAAYAGDVRAMRHIVDHAQARSAAEGVVNSPGHQGSTPLAIAAMRGNLAAVRYLLERGGALVDAHDASGLTALDVAAEAGQGVVVECLVFHKAQPTPHAIEWLHASRSQVAARAAAHAAAAASPLALSAAWADRVARMPPLTTRLLALGEEPSAIDAAQLLLEQAAGRQACIDSLQKFRGARAALTRTEAQAVLRVPSALSTEQCAALRQAVDVDGTKSTDSVDELLNHDLGLSVVALQQIVGRDATARLLALPRRYAEAAMMGKTITPGFTIAGLFARRYSNQTEHNEQPLTSFHFDSAAMTVNVALTADADIEGGRLLGVYGGAVQTLSRDEGEATVHSSSLMHGVTMMRRGVRYSLICFFSRLD